MKRNLAIILALIVALTLAACGGNAGESEDNGVIDPGSEEDPNLEKETEPSEITYTVSWYDADGNSIKRSRRRKGIEGENVSIKESDKVVSGYSFDATDDRNVVSGTLSDEEVALKLYFTKNVQEKATITIRYVDESGSEVGVRTIEMIKGASNQKFGGLRSPDGYEIVRTEDDTNGTIEDGMTITVIVKKIDQPHDHSYTAEVVEPTCTTEGVTTYTCTSCGNAYTEKAPSLGHSFDTWATVLSATCTEYGNETRSCTRCGKTESRDIPATGHAWGEWNITAPAGPGVEGEETRVCANDASHTETRPIEALPLPKFEELTVVDNDQCVIKITGIDEDASSGYTLKVYIENKSPDKTYSFDVIDASINGVQDLPYFSAEVAPGEKSNARIVFSNIQYYGYDIGEYTDIEMTFLVFDSDDEDAGYVVNKSVHFYPRGEESATTFDWEPKETDTVIVDNDDIKVVAIGYKENGRFGGYDVDLYMVNKTDRELKFSVDNTSMNDFEMSSTVWGAYVSAGNGMFSAIYFWDRDFEENDITSVEKIEFTLRVRYNEMFAEDFYKESITLVP